MKLQRNQGKTHHHNYSFGHEAVNRDLEVVQSARKLPRFSFKTQPEERSTSSSEGRRRPRDKAVDSNKVLMRVYYLKKLLQKSLRALEQYP